MYFKLFLPRVRGGIGGARKRYVGLLDGKDAGNIEFVGMEVVRRDWTALAKRSNVSSIAASSPTSR